MVHGVAVVLMRNAITQGHQVVPYDGLFCSENLPFHAKGKLGRRFVAAALRFCWGCRMDR